MRRGDSRGRIRQHAKGVWRRRLGPGTGLGSSIRHWRPRAAPGSNASGSGEKAATSSRAAWDDDSLEASSRSGSDGHCCALKRIHQRDTHRIESNATNQRRAAGAHGPPHCASPRYRCTGEGQLDLQPSTSRCDLLLDRRLRARAKHAVRLVKRKGWNAASGRPEGGS